MEVINTIGRRKKAIARVYMKEGSGAVKINKRDAADYFPTDVLQYKMNQPFAITDTEKKYDLHINVDGGGQTGQVEAVRLAISRALIEVNPDYKPDLKAAGLTTRDPRMVERKKPGQPKARKKFQFSKR
ncbi:MAG: 30S ribosomal protein S9 [Flavobacteriales bacterium]|nr:30S ribosomal protein S9 [Flavobacteriales bacterium]